MFKLDTPVSDPDLDIIAVKLALDHLVKVGQGHCSEDCVLEADREGGPCKFSN
jgi:hypothetical protein